jgi:ketosteroid isomerase-like protein
VVTDGDTVVVEFRSTGTAPSGRSYALEFTEVIELREGKIATVKVYLDPDEVERAMG